MFIDARPVSFVNAAVLTPDEAAASLRVARGRIASIGESPRRGDTVVDCDGATIVPGLINAHDHLELNSFGRLKWRTTYDNVRGWIEDFQPRFASDPALALNRPETLDDRLFAGGLKNLLSGVTTVAHHNPLYPSLCRPFPVRVVRRYGWGHSLQIDGDRLAESYRRTPITWPWIVHAAEGADWSAALEMIQLEKLGCVGPNTVLVHGVGLLAADSRRAVERGVALVWCPSSNRYLFGRTARVGPFAEARRLAIGTDSRMSGDADLLAELRAARRTGQLHAAALLRAVTSDAADVLRLDDAGRLGQDLPADLTIFAANGADPCSSVLRARRTTVRLVMIGGRPLVADASFGDLFAATRTRAATSRVDGRPSLLAAPIARRLRRSAIEEPGLEIEP